MTKAAPRFKQMFFLAIDTIGGIWEFALNVLPWVLCGIVIPVIICWIGEVVAKFKSPGAGAKVHVCISIAATIVAYAMLSKWFNSFWWNAFWSSGLDFMIISPESPERKTSKTYSKPQEPDYIEGLVNDYMQDMKMQENVRKGADEAIRNTGRD